MSFANKCLLPSAYFRVLILEPSAYDSHDTLAYICVFCIVCRSWVGSEWQVLCLVSCVSCDLVCILKCFIVCRSWLGGRCCVFMCLVCLVFWVLLNIFTCVFYIVCRSWVGCHRWQMPGGVYCALCILCFSIFVFYMCVLVCCILCRSWAGGRCQVPPDQEV